jgi:hypothetical protein
LDHDRGRGCRCSRRRRSDNHPRRPCRCKYDCQWNVDLTARAVADNGKVVCASLFFFVSTHKDAFVLFLLSLCLQALSVPALIFDGRLLTHGCQKRLVKSSLKPSTLKHREWSLQQTCSVVFMSWVSWHWTITYVLLR